MGYLGLGLVPNLVKLLDSSDSDLQEAALAVAVMFAEPPQQVRYLHEVRSFAIPMLLIVEVRAVRYEAFWALSTLGTSKPQIVLKTTFSRRIPRCQPHCFLCQLNTLAWPVEH